MAFASAIPPLAATIIMDNPYESPRSNEPNTSRSGFPTQLVLLILGNVTLIAAAVSFSVLAQHFHQEYGKAHAAAYRGVRVSPEPFFQRAGYAANAIIPVCVAALIGAFRTKHPISIVSLLLCVVILVYTMDRVGVRY